MTKKICPKCKKTKFIFDPTGICDDCLGRIFFEQYARMEKEKLERIKGQNNVKN
jgi:hypothetical protein